MSTSDGHQNVNIKNTDDMKSNRVLHTKSSSSDVKVKIDGNKSANIGSDQNVNIKNTDV